MTDWYIFWAGIIPRFNANALQSPTTQASLDWTISSINSIIEFIRNRFDSIYVVIATQWDRFQLSLMNKEMNRESNKCDGRREKKIPGDNIQFTRRWWRHFFFYLKVVSTWRSIEVASFALYCFAFDSELMQSGPMIDLLYSFCAQAACSQEVKLAAGGNSIQILRSGHSLSRLWQWEMEWSDWMQSMTLPSIRTRTFHYTLSDVQLQPLKNLISPF